MKNNTDLRKCQIILRGWGGGGLISLQMIGGFVLKNARISDFEEAVCGLADFEGSADHAFLQYFSVAYGFCLF